jgi:uncharacterized membrane-anchored protein
MGRTLRILLLAIAMIAVILGMVAMYAKDLKSGTEITLKTEPVDPRSLFLGHYATLSYAINRLEIPLFAGHCYKSNDFIFVTLEPSDAGEWVPVRVTPNMPAEAFGENRVTLRGRLQWWNEPCGEDASQPAVTEPVPERVDAAPTEPAADATTTEAAAETVADDPPATAEGEEAVEPPVVEEPFPMAATVWVNYGIEQYFASPDAARRLEDLARRRAPAEGEELQEPLEIILSVPRSGRALIKGVVIDGEKLYDQTLY